MQGVKRKKEVGLTSKEREKFIEFKKWVGEHGCDGSSLILLLHRAQQLFGYLPRPVQEYVAEMTNRPLSEVYGVTTFYSFFTLFPKGRHTIRVCLGTACYVKGGKKILASVEKKLGVRVRETTPNRRFSIEVNRCMGACALAPVMVVDKDIYARVSAARVPEILERYQ